jgi:hypothetical protein
VDSGKWLEQTEKNHEFCWRDEWHGQMLARTKVRAADQHEGLDDTAEAMA